MPGVCGASDEAYIMDLAQEASFNGYNVLIINPISPPKLQGEIEDVGLESCDFSNNIYIIQAVEQIKKSFG